MTPFETAYAEVTGLVREPARDHLTRKCEYRDNEIDKLVYELYGLTEEEIRVVEGENLQTSK